MGKYIDIEIKKAKTKPQVQIFIIQVRQEDKELAETERYSWWDEENKVNMASRKPKKNYLKREYSIKLNAAESSINGGQRTDKWIWRK